MRQISQNIVPILESSAKSGHIKALINNHTPPIKVSVYEKLHFQVVSTVDMAVPLGDSAVIFNIKGETAFKPYFEIDNKLLAVILPISSRQLLVGSKRNYQLKIEEIPEAIACCSLDYFIASEQSTNNEGIAKHISKNARMISDSEIEEILSDLMVST